MGDETWRVTAEDIHRLRSGDQDVAEAVLRMLDRMALAGGEYVIRCGFPGPQAGGGFFFTVRRFNTRSWWAWLLWWVGARPLPLDARAF